MLPILLALACTACFSTPEPPASLGFERFTQKKYEYYEFVFKSNVDFFSTYWVKEGRPVIRRMLVCSLDGDTDFSVEHTLQRFMRGEIESIGRAAEGKQTQYNYAALVNFSETLDGGRSDNHLSGDAINQLLADRSTVPCKVIMTIYLSKPYYSKTMQVPAKALLDAVTVHQ
ncbi:MULTISPECIES: hypothetical protein [unclassified Dyella]|uniref:hypothetical protein n=1 Tax=unclassified Dyella TaxID=2634549 RepID=UPI001E2B9E27|nr:MULTISPECIES: hypothetical protein [unclassified Dyella]